MDKFSSAAASHFQAARFYNPGSNTERAAVAVSACLAGEKVRYDGADKLLPIYSLLQKELHLIPICPEIGAGLGVPRPPVQLVALDNNTHALGRENRALDVTQALQNFAEISLRRLLRDHSLCGYLWKSRSPSCGFGSTPLFTADGIEFDRVNGIQANYFQQHLPYLCHCEEIELETVNAAMGFVLRCRVVFDAMHASNATLQTLHRHYTFLHENFAEEILQRLEIAITQNDKKNYLATLMNGCSQISNDVLIELFN